VGGGERRGEGWGERVTGLFALPELGVIVRVDDINSFRTNALTYSSSCIRGSACDELRYT
jgi:hypothetical protein